MDMRTTTEGSATIQSPYKGGNSVLNQTRLEPIAGLLRALGRRFWVLRRQARQAKPGDPSDLPDFVSLRRQDCGTGDPLLLSRNRARLAS